MKKLLGIVVLGLLLSGNAYAAEFYLKCKTIKKGMYVTNEFGYKLNQVRYLGINLKNKVVRTNWDEFNAKFEDNDLRVQSSGNKYIKINFRGSEWENYEYEQIDRETGLMTHPRFDEDRNKKTPIQQCEAIEKNDLPTKKVKKKF